MNHIPRSESSDSIYAKLNDFAESLSDVGSINGDKPDQGVDQQTSTIMLAFGKPFGLSETFWRGAFIASCSGCFMGLVALAFFNAFVEFFDTWTGDSYKHKLKNAELRMWSGEYWWIFFMMMGGLIIGLLKVWPVMNVPKVSKGLFAEVIELHVDYYSAPGILLCSCLSLAFGFSVGPEAALGTLGGAIGTLVATWRRLPQEEHHSNTINGMCGALGSLFPSPILAVMCIVELCVVSGHMPDSFMETVVTGGVAACCAWMVFVGLQDRTFLESLDLPVAFYDITDFEMWYMGAAALLGVIAGVLGLIILIALGVFRKIAKNQIKRLGHTRATVILPVVAGLLCGVVGVALPLTLGDGTAQLKQVIVHAEDYGKGILSATIFAKIFTLAVSLGFGCIGGQIFPCMYIGVLAAEVCHMLYPDIFPIGLALPCMMMAVPASFSPIPFTLASLGAFVLVLGSKLAAPVFLCIVVAFMTVCGTGVIQGIVLKQALEQAQLLRQQLRRESEHQEAQLRESLNGVRLDDAHNFTMENSGGSGQEETQRWH